MFYDDFVPGIVSRLKDLKVCRQLQQQRGDQKGVERCNQNIAAVRKNWREFYEAATRNTQEYMATSGEEICPLDEKQDSDEDDEFQGEFNDDRELNRAEDDVREENKEEELSAAEEDNSQYSSSAEFSPAEEDDSHSNEEPSADEESQNSKKNENKTRTKSKAKNETKAKPRTKAKASNRRMKRACPIPTCDAKVVHLPRHLRDAHGWHKEKARVAVQQFNFRKAKPVSVSIGGKRKRDYHVKKKCPITGCLSVVRRIADHLTKVHKLRTDSKVYKKALKFALKAPVGEHVFQKLKRARVEREQMMNEVMKPDSNDNDSAGATCDRMIDNLSGERKKEERTEMRQDFTDTEGGQEVYEDELSQDFTDGEEGQEAAEIMGSDETEERQELSDDIQTAFATQILNSFKTWLKSPDGGKNDEKTADQHMKQLHKLLGIISPDLELSSLFDYKLIRDKFITAYAEDMYYPKTIKSYIMSVRHFYTYVISDEPPEIKIDKAMLISFRERLQRWSVSYKKDCNKHQWEKREEDLARIVTPAMVGEFEKSQAARDAIILIGKLSGASNVEISQRKFTLIRDFLMIQISINNANRAGVLANMTVPEFRAAKLQDDDESYVVRVMNHKTLDSKGPATVVLRKKLHSWMDVYLKNVRPRVCDNRGVVQFFLSWNGKSLESSQIAKALKSVFKKADMDVQISSNDFRKGAVTEVHDKHKEFSSSLAILLDHTESTAQRYYLLTDKAKSSVKASKQLAMAMKGSKPIVDNDVGDKEPEGPTIQETKAATKWDTASVEALRRLFAQQIEEQTITISCVKEKIVGTEELENRKARDVLQKIRSQWRFPRQEESAGPSNDEVQLPSETETVNQRIDRLLDDDNMSSTSVISPTTRASSSNVVFSRLDVELVVELCTDMLDSAPVSKKVITERLQNNDEGKKLLAKVSINQLVNRIKYERRMKRERSSSNK